MGTATGALQAESYKAESYKAEQRRQWDATAGELRGWWPVFEGFMTPVTQSMLDHARLQAGAQVIDVASGFGEPALTVARLVGPKGRVVATDLSAAMLAVAGERARALGLDNLGFAEMDAEKPAFPQGSFDAVVCRLGLMFLPHLAVALERLGGLLIPGGRLVAAVWGPQEANPWLNLALRTVVEFLELPPPPAEAPWLFGLGGAGVLEEALSGAGLQDIRRTDVALHCHWPSVGAFTAFHESSPLRRLAASEEPARRVQAWHEVTAAATRRWGDGPLHLGGEVVVVSGRRQPTRLATPTGRASPQALASPHVGRRDPV
ncbi:MAG TPA: class I SAM-dependent methyltransferase, partial [Chloroflexota bacterium]|nr:class I SAM-dependent methyltransferase [Chloroflexota bacterium]